LVDEERRVRRQDNLGRRDAAVSHLRLNLPQEGDERFKKPWVKVILGFLDKEKSAA